MIRRSGYPGYCNLGKFSRAWKGAEHPSETGCVVSARRAALAVRERSIEGYVAFESDPTRYEFTPEADFVYPAAVH